MGRTKSRIGALKRVEVLSLLAFDFSAEPWELASSSCSSVKSTKRLLQELRQAQDLEALAIEI